MSFEIITFRANGREFQGWESVTVTAGIAQAAREFEIATTEIIKANESPFDKWNFPPFTRGAVYATSNQSASGGDLLVEGIVDEYLPDMGPESHTVVIKGRGLSSSVVDSSAKHETGRFENQSVLQILQTIAKPFGVNVQPVGTAASVVSAIVPVFQLRRGERAWTEMTRLINDYAVALSGMADGHLMLLRAGIGRHAGGIAQGD
ncbi:MAG: hypothetical protein L0287_36085, partial [Anaerolineae bacterium]|nr:hypothetical protein [Anaerolineae bacterium]